MKLNATSEYAMRAMLDLARRAGEQTTLDEIASRQHIPVTMLPNIVQTLAKAGLVETTRGHGGGVRLGRPAEEINVRTVLQAVQGPLQLHRCDSVKRSCPLGAGERCPLRGVWEKTESRMLELWEQTSLSDLVEAHWDGEYSKSTPEAAG